MFPRTITVPDSSSIFAKLSPWPGSEQPSTQISTYSEYGIQLLRASLSIDFTLSNCANLSNFRASSADNPSTASDFISGGRSPSSRSLSLAMSIPRSFSISFSPTGRDRASGALIAAWNIALLWRSRRRIPS